ncbi:MAG: GNAT family N-acetyltransferase, partial [Actinomycetota bacterium]|nr:GNAT family N-acetyltransferase [Actinomycetota bacterium]
MTTIRVSGHLTEQDVAGVLGLVRLAAEDDGVAPLSEHVMLHLKHGGDSRARNVLLLSDGTVAGYAHLDPTDPVEGPSGELVIHPAFRGRHLATELVHALIADAGGSPLRLWAHGDLPAATRLAAATGFTRIRSLWQ